jgi:hypothetical protein
MDSLILSLAASLVHLLPGANHSPGAKNGNSVAGIQCGNRSVPRGRIELPTPAFSGPRSTDELPRHGDNQRFYGKRAEVKRENARLHRG